MQFFLNNIEINFSEFAQHFPDEAKILTDYLELPAKFEIQEGVLALAFDQFNPISIDIEKILEHHKKFFYKHSLYKDPLARALGLKKGKSRPIVLDATAGLLGDSLLMYAYGPQQLICCERNPVVAALIVNAINRAKIDIKFYFGEASAQAQLPEVDVVFYDPMYKEKNVKAAPKKEMAIFRELVGEDTDSYEVARNLYSLAKERLVIKRSNRATPLIEQPDHSIKGKSTSYDVYLAKN